MKPWPRLLTQYSAHRSDSGRLASGVDNTDEEKKVKQIGNLHNIPKKIRDSVVADPGMMMVGADYAAIEWAILQLFAAKVPSYLKKKHGVPEDFHMKLFHRFQAGKLDPHIYLASIAYNKSEDQVTSHERRVCKPFTHGRSYFGSPRTLARQAGFADKIGIKVCEAHSEAFKPEAWWEYTLEMVKANKCIETPLGWRRYMWEWDPKPTEVFGTLIQATAADLMKYVLVDLHKGPKPFELDIPKETPFNYELLTTTHDSILAQATTGLILAVGAWIKSKMEQPIPWLDGYTFRCDVKVGKNWKEVS